MLAMASRMSSLVRVAMFSSPQCRRRPRPPASRSLRLSRSRSSVSSRGASALGRGRGFGLGSAASASASASASRLRPRPGVGCAATFVDEGLAARRRSCGAAACEQAGELLHRRGHGAGQLASSTSRDGSSARARTSSALSSFVPSRPPLTTSVGFVRAQSRSALATAAASPSTNAIAVGPVSSSSISRPRSRAAKRTRRVLVDLVLAAGFAQRSAQLRDRGDVEPAVLGQHRRARAREAFLHLVDDRDLLGSRVLHGHLLSFLGRARVQRGHDRVRPRRCPPRQAAALTNGSGDLFSARTSAPDVFGEQFGLCRTGTGYGATVSSRKRLGSTLTPGPMVGATVMLLM